MTGSSFRLTNIRLAYPSHTLKLGCRTLTHTLAAPLTQTLLPHLETSPHQKKIKKSLRTRAKIFSLRAISINASKTWWFFQTRHLFSSYPRSQSSSRPTQRRFCVIVSRCWIRCRTSKLFALKTDWPLMRLRVSWSICYIGAWEKSFIRFGRLEFIV